MLHAVPVHPHLFVRDRRFEKRTCAGASGRSSAWRYACGLSFWEPCLVRSLEILHLAQLAPAWLAANMQSLRKYIEHVGLMGSTVNSSTRSIVAHGWLGKLVAFTLLHEPFHGVHHRHSGLPHAKLPSSLHSSSRRGRMNDRPFRVIGKHFKISSSLADPARRSGTSPSPSARSIWPRLAKEARQLPAFSARLGHEFFIARWRGRQAARLRGGRSEEGFRRWAGASVARSELSHSEGDFVAITGPSGCGKTTLLQLLGGLDRPTAGTLRYRGTR